MNNNKPWNLWLDDMRNPLIFFPKEDNTMIFLKELFGIWNEDKNSIPYYNVHSDNPNGRDNIISFMESWNKSKYL